MMFCTKKVELARVEVGRDEGRGKEVKREGGCLLVADLPTLTREPAG